MKTTTAFLFLLIFLLTGLSLNGYAVDRSISEGMTYDTNYNAFRDIDFYTLSITLGLRYSFTYDSPQPGFVQQYYLWSNRFTAISQIPQGLFDDVPDLIPFEEQNHIGKFYADISFYPAHWIKGAIGFEVFYGNPNTYALSVNPEHRMFDSSQTNYGKFIFNDGSQDLGGLAFTHGYLDIELPLFNESHLRLFAGHDQEYWRFKGDYFRFLPAHYDVERYRRYTGYALPLGGQLYLDGDFGEIDIIGGPEVKWGDNWGIYGRYTKRVENSRLSVIAMYHGILYGYQDENDNPNEFQSGFQASYTYYMSPAMNVAASLLFSPNRIGTQYTETKQLPNGNYDIQTWSSSFLQAFAGKFVFEALYNSLKPFDVFIADLTLAGPLAGNKIEGHLFGSYKLDRFTSLFVDVVGRMNTIGPSRLVVERDNNGHITNVLNTPRGRNSAFFVSNTNREGFSMNAGFTIDYTDDSWTFFRYEPLFLEDWNTDIKSEKGIFSFALLYNMQYYPSTTDYEPFTDSRNNWIWPNEPASVDKLYFPNAIPALSGLWPMTRPFHKFKMMLISSPFAGFDRMPEIISTMKVYLKMEIGDDYAWSSLAYTGPNTTLEPNYNDATDIYSVPNTLYTLVSGRLYLFDESLILEAIWGNTLYGLEEWQQQYGQVMDQFFFFGATYVGKNLFNLGFDHILSLQYIAAHEIDNLYHGVASPLGPFDEFKIFYHIRYQLPLLGH